MAAPKVDPSILAHREWLKFVQPTGLVVSAPALARAGAILDRNDAEGQRLLRAGVEERMLPGNEKPVPVLPDFSAFARTVLGWSFSLKGYAGTAESPIPPELEAALPESEGVLRPDFAVRELDPKDDSSPWQLLVQVLPLGEDLDGEVQSRLERLLRAVRVPAGLLFNGRVLRLLSAPTGESSGWLDFQVADMVKTAGRPIATALRLLLGEPRLLSLPRNQRFAALLEDSRRYQNEVSERLAEQVLHALYELLRGFQAAHDASHGKLLREPLANHPDEVYRALLTVILRLVFLLYAEERDMLPKDETFQRSYSLAGLYDRLREDAALYPDTLDQRFGAWAQLVVLFRMIYDGAEHGEMHLPKRHGALFDPDRFPFLEGRRSFAVVQTHVRFELPRVPDGMIYRAFEKLLVLDGERISYRALDVEQIGSVYETMMGFRLETASGKSVAIKAPKKQGAPTAVDLEALLGVPAAQREGWIQARTDRKLTDKIKKAVKEASSLDDLHAALLTVIDSEATPDLVPQGAMVLQPSEERRRSGSHYTPRSLTEPIVRTTLEPILARLRGPDDRPPRPEQILDLKVCDPAMGSGAFLVEACRQLGEVLVDSWRHYGEMPSIPADEDEVIYARRLVAKRCIYGVDRNLVAVDLAKVSLWLVTLAKDHPLTFVDHALRHGDSLVGLSRKQIEAFHWDESKPPVLRGLGLRDSLDTVIELRQRIREAGEGVPDGELRDWWIQAQSELKKVRILGDLVLAAFFEGDSAREREAKRNQYVAEVLNGTAEDYCDRLEDWREAAKPLVPFHWEVEFPEVFERESPGFDAIVANPPFLGGLKLETAYGRGWRAFVVSQIGGGIRGVRGTADLCAYFILRSGQLIREGVGCIGSLATNTISEGDTSEVGLCHLLNRGALVYAAEKSFRWPGTASVVASKVWITKQRLPPPYLLEGRPVSVISAQLREGEVQDTVPVRLISNAGISFQGSIVLGDGFLLSPNQREELLRTEPIAARILYRHLNGIDLNSRADMSASRWVINFRDWPLTRETADSDYAGPVASDFPKTLQLVVELIKPERQAKEPTNSWNKKVRTFWWHLGQYRWALEAACEKLSHVIVLARTSRTLAFARLPTEYLFSDTLYVFATDRWSMLSILQSNAHHLWAQRFSSSLKGDLRYTNSGVFETFPLPEAWSSDGRLNDIGEAYQACRSDLQLSNLQGLTTIYDRFHDPGEHSAGVVRLRDLHVEMDRAVLDAYGWNDIPTTCEFLLDYEIDGENWGNKKKPWHYRWSDDVRAEVLARLLELNAKRAKQEKLSGAATAKKGRGRKGGPKSEPDTPPSEDLFS